MPAVRWLTSPGRARVVDDLLQGVGREVHLAREENPRHVIEPCHRHELLERIERQRRIADQRHEQVGGDIADQEGVAVGLGADGLLQRDDAVAAGLVLHHHRLAELFLEVLAQDARDDVGGAARSVGHDDADGFGRVIRCVRRRECAEQQQCRKQHTFHVNYCLCVSFPRGRLAERRSRGYAGVA
jgi:hypothetical protein